MNPKRDFAQAACAFAGLVDQLPAEIWTLPALGVWDMRALVGHASRSLITVDTYLDRPAGIEAVASPEAYYVQGLRSRAAGSHAVAERGRQAGVALGADPARAVHDLVSRVVPRVEASEDLLIETIAGGMRLSTYLPTRTFELVVHSLDIASAAGLPAPDFPTDVVANIAAMAARVAVLAGLGNDLLLALTGRRPLPDGFSIV